jgi:peptidoglycan/LPS O-acetylase OafA/YrhL
MNTSYRPDIDGLRAVAVLSVLFFHAFPEALPGGFVGVDVFFVISGFLITGIILAQSAAGNFTIGGFYSRRIRRIFPALSLVLASVIAFGWLALAPYAFRQLGWHALFSAAFGENIWLWQKAGDYFDEGSAVKPLLHLWSLGVEEQYYLIWPLLLLLIRRRLSLAAWLIAAVAAASFVANLLTVGDSPKLAFYWPHTRFWELMIGSALAYWDFHRSNPAPSPLRDFSAFAGLCALACGLLLIDESRAFPGWWALLPTLGTAALIASRGAWVNRLLARQPLVYIGLISYPLYLWHWPILVYLRIVTDAEPSAGARLAALALSAVLAWLTYELLEKRVRGRQHAIPVLAASMCAMGLAGLLVLGGILPARSAAVPGIPEITDAFEDWDWKAGSHIKGDTEDTVMLAGDSHMQQFLPRLDHFTATHPGPMRSVIVRARGGCVPIPGIDRVSAKCAPYVAKTLQMARDPRVSTIVIAASWTGFLSRDDYYREGDPDRVPLDLNKETWVWTVLQQELSRLASDGKHIVMFLESPRGETLDPRTIAVRKGLSFEIRGPRSIARAAMDAETEAANAHIRRVAQAVGAQLVDPMQTLCDATRCSPVDDAGRPLYKDMTHVRSSVARDRLAILDPFILAAPPRPGAQ